MTVIVQSLNYNAYGELIIQAITSDGKNISRSGGLQVPQAPFALLYDFRNNEWYTSTINQIPDNCNLIQIIQNDGDTFNVEIT
jgi:hypothetical protein